MLAAAPDREGTDREILAELVTGVAWVVVLDTFRKRARMLKNKAFSDPDTSVIVSSIEAHNQIKALVSDIYTKARISQPAAVREIFE